MALTAMFLVSRVDTCMILASRIRAQGETAYDSRPMLDEPRSSEGGANIVQD